MGKFKAYAVKRGRQTGVFETCNICSMTQKSSSTLTMFRVGLECERQVKGFSGAMFKGFGSNAEAVAWLAKLPPTPCEKYKTEVHAMSHHAPEHHPPRCNLKFVSSVPLISFEVVLMAVKHRKLLTFFMKPINQMLHPASTVARVCRAVLCKLHLRKQPSR
jgi:hypothetical protein